MLPQSLAKADQEREAQCQPIRGICLTDSRSEVPLLHGGFRPGIETPRASPSVAPCRCALPSPATKSLAPIRPEGWRNRLVEIRNENTRGAKGLCLEIHDLLIAKLIAGREKDLAFLHGEESDGGSWRAAPASGNCGGRPGGSGEGPRCD